MFLIISEIYLFLFRTHVTYFRFSVTSATGSSSYWNIGEFMMYDAEVAIDDPETAPLD